MTNIKNTKVLGLQFENKINLGEVLTIITTFTAIGVMSFGIWKDLYDRTNNNKERIVVSEQAINTMQMQYNRDRGDIKEDLNEIKESLKDVNKQLVMDMQNNAKNR